MRHIRETPRGDWVESSVGSTATLNGVSGIDSCGRLAIVREVVTSSGEAGLSISHWTGQAWAVQENLRDYQGINVFDGIGHNDVWLVAWSGLWRGKTTATNAGLKIWLFVP
jgi:hypothetical protein